MSDTFFPGDDYEGPAKPANTDPYANFDSDEGGDDDDGYQPLKPGSYHMRVVAFQRGKSKNGDPQLIFRLKVLAGPSKGTTIWWITLTPEAKFFVKKACNAVGGFKGNLHSDNDVSQRFLGKVVKSEVSVSEKQKDGKMVKQDRLDDVLPAEPEFVMEHPHDPPETYWGKEVFKKKDDTSDSGKSKSTGKPKSGPADDFRDDDIPF